MSFIIDAVKSLGLASWGQSPESFITPEPPPPPPPPPAGGGPGFLSGVKSAISAMTFQLKTGYVPNIGGMVEAPDFSTVAATPLEVYIGGGKGGSGWIGGVAGGGGAFITHRLEEKRNSHTAVIRERDAMGYLGVEGNLGYVYPLNSSVGVGIEGILGAGYLWGGGIDDGSYEGERQNLVALRAGAHLVINAGPAAFLLGYTRMFLVNPNTGAEAKNYSDMDLYGIALRIGGAGSDSK